jgi:ferritin-like metal-binding protein YciE
VESAEIIERGNIMAKDENRESLIDWLRDAHAMENQAATVMETHAGRIQHYPRFKELLEMNAEESRAQADRLRACVESLGGSTSALKDMTGRLIGLAQTISGYFAEDEVVKGVLALYTFKHYEIGSYRILLSTAHMLNETQVASLVGEHLDREIELADQLEEHLGEVANVYLEREKMQVKASR